MVILKYALSQGNHSFSRIANASKVESKNLTYYLNTLIQTDLIKRKESFLSNKKGITRYTINDAYTNFWFKFIYPYKSELTILEPDVFISEYILPNIDRFLGKYFESFCGKIIQKMSFIGIFEEKIVRTHHFQGKFLDSISKQTIDYDIDIIGLGVSKKLLIFAECKWWQKEIKISEIKQFIQYQNYFRANYQDFISKYEKIKLIFFSRLPVQEEIQKKFHRIEFFSLQDINDLIMKEK